ncbi:MAG: hypothetical protein QM687_12265 [Ferruginibacter sp.]
MKYVFQLALLATLLLTACSKKTTPTATKEEPKKPTEVYRPPVKTPTPKSIVVSDAAAKKDVNGRYYYDLEGKRYWRNKKDGKYYLYYKGMFEKPEFQ